MRFTPSLSCLCFQHGQLFRRVGLPDKGPGDINNMKYSFKQQSKRQMYLVFWMITNQPQSLMLMYFLKFLWPTLISSRWSRFLP